MQAGPFGAIVWVVVIAVIAVSFRRQRRRGRIGAAGVGSIYGMLNEDRRHAVEIVVEEKAASRDPEHRDHNLPALKQKPLTPS